MIDTSNLTDRVYLEMRSKIINKELEPGERINYDLHCEEMGISPTPLRYAINRLQQDGLVEVKPRLGTFVSRPNSKNIMDVYDVRKAVECLALDLSFDSFSEQMVDDLLREVNFASKHLLEDNYQGYFSIDRNFHSTIINLSKNNYIFKIMGSLEYLIQWFSVLTSKNVERPYSSNEQHKEILFAIQRKDRKKAEELLEEHIEIAKRTMLEDYGDA
ncbi:GntR family transcriptional regulator [Aneurinibacillus tyrosinisolvens]|uniref:GntR family transcriptional regulator n=1 Tax=Aneurinibacillus tyrosinisolvens TaxID=1443435 RepID=UPI00063F8010|nr:GntR family transcriptional regulator [Aneurinibacillus tyrosinisolvens]